ncbi:manganese superoxide dismutase [Clavulina sp. PMI_390]|nr:manganese superoxide dismutase [Clavulina sp. PMI_390]
MFRLARNAVKLTLSRNFRAPATLRSLATLPELPYAHNALEPYISTEIMELHHLRHHQAYVDGLNAAEAAYIATTSPKERLALRPAIQFNGGGHINHSLFWKNLAPVSAGGGKLQAGPLKDMIERDFGSLAGLREQLNAQTAAIQGSGWGWLAYNKQKTLEIVTTLNQDPLLDSAPLIGIDIWEHAYYLQYLNIKPDYLNAIWNVINFNEAEARLLAAQSSP